MAALHVQAISNSLWSYSKLGYNPGHRVLDIAARRAAVMLHQYTSQEIANTLWAFATLEQNPGSGMLDAAAMQMSRRIEQFSPQVCSFELEIAPPCFMHHGIPAYRDVQLLSASWSASQGSGWRPE